MSLNAAIPLNPNVARDSVIDARAKFRHVVDLVNQAHGAALPDARPSARILRDLGGEGEAADLDIELTPLTGTRVVLVPGFLTECVSFLCTMMFDAKVHLENLGAECIAPLLDGRGGAAHNARQLRDVLLALDDATNPGINRTIVIAMSKGAVDTLEMLAAYPQTHDKVDAVVALVGAVWGSPLAHIAPKWLKWVERRAWMPTCRTHGGEAVKSLTPDVRAAFMTTLTTPGNVKLYTLGAACGAEDMSAGMTGAYRALCRISPLNDGQMLLADQALPNADYLGVLDCDHMATAMPFNRAKGLLGRFVARRWLDKNAFPREVMAEALVRYITHDLSL